MEKGIPTLFPDYPTGAIPFSMIVFGMSYDLTFDILDSVGDKKRKKLTQLMFLENRLYFINLFNRLMCQYQLPEEQIDDLLHWLIRLALYEYLGEDCDKDEFDRVYGISCERLNEYSHAETPFSRALQ